MFFLYYVKSGIENEFAINFSNLTTSVTSQERQGHSRWRKFWIWKSFNKVKMGFWKKKTNGTLGVLDIIIKQLFGKKMYVLGVYIPSIQ